MTVKELYKILNEKIPSSLSCEWDNDGLMCCPDGDRIVRRVLVALDVTGEVADAAIKGEYDVIVSHHPFIFKGLKSINEENYVAEKAVKLIKNGISVFSFHTRLDALGGGVNDCLCALLELENVSAFGEGGIGRVGELPSPTSAEELALTVKELLGAKGVLLSDCGKICRRVAVLGGEGGDDLGAAIAAGADTYISGRLGYHTMTDAPDMGINLIEAGHFYTENPVCTALVEMIREADAAIDCDVYHSNKIKLI